jgi:hypothetical protein
LGSAQLGTLGPYSLVFCHQKQENVAILPLHAQPSVIPARFQPESRNTTDWIPAKGMPE